ncbi:MAG TPA: hypothetical protein VGF63_04265 [Solirubrobacteraceae bacterium]|jgi:hypothetical protein
MTDFIEGLERDLVQAADRLTRTRRTAAIARRRRLPGRGLAIAVAALVVAGSATAAVVRLATQPSEPLAGPIGASRAYAVSLAPDLRAGQAGWCGGVRYSSGGRTTSGGTGCAPPRAAGGAIVVSGLGGVGETIRFAITIPSARAVRFAGAMAVATRGDRTLPYGWRYAVATRKPPSDARRPGPSSFAAPIALAADGRKLPATTQADRGTGGGSSRLVTGAAPARRCVIGGARGFAAGYARVAVRLPHLPSRIEGRAFASCAYTVFHVPGSHAHVTAAILLDAQRPSSRAAALPPVPGLDGHRLGRGWVVASGATAARRRSLLARLHPRL